MLQAMLFASLAGTFTNIWFGWLLAFVVIELVGWGLDAKDKVQNDQGGTFSELVWRLIKSNRLVFALFSLFYIVLGLHFFVIH